MLRISKYISFVSLVFFFQSTAIADISANDEKIKALAEKLSATGKDSVLISQVAKQNAEKFSMSEITKRDEQWKSTSGVDSFMKDLMSNSAANRLAEIEKQFGTIVESFLMDNQGANVAMTNKTSDYWQGDEAKFKESFKNGAGGIHISKSEFDKSAQAYLIQISVPVIDNGKVIGAITYGVNVDEL